MILNPENIFILQSIKAENENSNDFFKIIKEINDWESIINSLIQNRLAPLVYKKILQANLSHVIPQNILNTLEKHYYKNVSRNTLLYYAFNNAISKWQTKNIECVALKGIFFAEKIYEDIGIRELSDIDILLKENDLEHASQLLLESGYIFENNFKSEFISKNRDIKHLPMLYKNGIGFELHKKLIHETPDYNIPTSVFFENTIQNYISNSSVLILSPIYQLIHICLHLDEHVINAKMHIIAYVDITWLISKNKNIINWIEFNEICEKYKCSKHIYRHLYIAYTYLNIEIPNFIVDKVKIYHDLYIDQYFLSSITCQNSFVKRKRNQNISEIKRIEGIKNKIFFLFSDLFPSKNFMVFRYKLKYQRLFFLYYFIRFFDGIKSIIKYLLKINQY